jgi:alkylated DNA repair dioxygenase AlkB
MKNYEELGLYLYPDYISDIEHSHIIEEIQSELIKSDQPKYIDRNKILRYGNQEICLNHYQNSCFPKNIEAISYKLIKDQIIREKPDAININEYLKGDFIEPHIDSVHHGKIVTILSVNSSATMLLTNGKNKFEIELLPKMLMQMKGLIRWHWHHSIYPVNEVRYSIVFRNINE